MTAKNELERMSPKLITLPRRLPGESPRKNKQILLPPDRDLNAVHMAIDLLLSAFYEQMSTACMTVSKQDDSLMLHLHDKRKPFTNLSFKIYLNSENFFALDNKNYRILLGENYCIFFNYSLL